MTGSSSVSGQGIDPECVLIGSMLNLEIYETPRGSLPPELQRYWDINQSEWDKLWEVRNSDGFHCAFYKPASASPGESSEACPPILVFRGSDSEPEDFAELAFGVNLDLNVVIDKPFPASDQTIPFSTNTSFSASENFTGKTLEEMAATGLRREDLFSGDDTSGSVRVPIEVDYWWDAEVRVEWSMEAALFYGMNGDWAVDFAQGLGQIPPQYTAAIEAGRRAAAEADRDWNGRLVMTGHSLGGGLASAAGIAAKVEKPDLNMFVRTYNAAGLHANTAQTAGGTLSSAGRVPVEAVHVKDEILNSMQAPTFVVPFLAKLMRWGNKSLPPAVSNPRPFAGISPGAMSISGKTYAPKGQGLPVLYPLEQQTLVTPAFSHMARLVGMANGARTPQQFLQRAITYVVDQLAAGRNLNSSEASELQEALGADGVFPSDLADQMTNAILHDGDIPQISLSGSAHITGQVQDFFNAMITDGVNLAKIFLASGEYHTFPPCAFTNILPLLE